MQFKEPRVFLIAETSTVFGGIQDLLEHIGAPDWSTDAIDGEELIEVAGRLCYKSFAPGLNPNVTKVREGNDVYIGNVLKQGHGSVLEHATVTFAFMDVSRVFTHELVRHRAGTAFSQESLRYVRLTDLGAYLPSALKGYVHGMEQVFNYLEEVQSDMAEHFELDDMTNFDKKKQITSAMRRLAPIGLTTNIIVTANHRAWRHIIAMRVNEHAEEEIRRVMFEVASVLKERFPNIYQDMTLDSAEGGHVMFDNEKV